MKTKLITLLSVLTLCSAASNASAAENAKRYIYNGKGQLIAVVPSNAKPAHQASAVASAGACSSCCAKKSG